MDRKLALLFVVLLTIPCFGQGILGPILVGLPQAGTPSFSPGAGTVASGTSVTISTVPSGCNSYIYYNTSGSTPTTGDTHGTSTTVSSSQTIYAKVIGCPGYADSYVGSAAYTVSVSGITLVQKRQNALSSGASSLTIGSGQSLATIASGHLVLVAVSNSSGADHITGVTDDKSGGSNTYTNVGTWSYANNFDSTTVVNLQLFYSCTTGTATTITINSLASGLISAVVREYSGIDCSGTALDAYAAQADSGTTTTSLTSGNVTPTQTGDLLTGACVTKSPPTPNTITAGTNYGDLYGYTADDIHIPLATEDRYPYASTTATPMTMTAASATYFNCRVAAFKAAP